MNPSDITWLLLVITLPTGSATARMRIWRNLKSLGCGAVRDGVYIIPPTDSLRSQFQDIADEITREGGTAWLFNVISHGDEERRYRLLFDRSEEYAEFSTSLTQAGRSLPDLTTQELNRLLRKLRKDYEALRATDYFPNETSARVEQAWKHFVALAETLLSVDEPHAIQAPVPQLRLSDYQGRLWATRQRLWVDRVASAWLIRRHIDRDARFLWLESPADCPEGALGFDFDGAAFTHIGDRVTFEVLLASFGLDKERGLIRLGAMVHALDLESGFVAEAAGFAAMLAGIRHRTSNDDELLAEVSPILDALHVHFSSNPDHKDPAGEAK
jgi:hypothetical protein